MAQKILFQTALTDTSTEDLEGAGVLRNDEKGNVYRWVQNNMDVATKAGAPVCFDLGNFQGTETDGFTEIVDAADEDLFVFAGIAMAACADESYLWVQVLGYYADARVAVATTGTGAVIVGDCLVCNTATSTAATAAAKAQSLIRRGSSTSASAATVTIPFYAMACEATAINTNTASTTPQSLNVFVKGAI